VRLVASGIVSPELTEQLSHSGATAMPAPSYCFADVWPQMITDPGDGHLHNQLPMVFGPITAYAYFCDICDRFYCSHRSLYAK